MYLRQVVKMARDPLNIQALPTWMQKEIHFAVTLGHTLLIHCFRGRLSKFLKHEAQGCLLNVQTPRPL